jgi:hypothetical protein
MQLTYTRRPTWLPQQSSDNTTTQHFQSHIRLITQYAAVFRTHRSLKIKVRPVLTNLLSKMNFHAIFWPSFVIACYSFKVSNITATLYVIHTVPVLTHNTSSNIHTVWYSTYDTHLSNPTWLSTEGPPSRSHYNKVKRPICTSKF